MDAAELTVLYRPMAPTSAPSVLWLAWLTAAAAIFATTAVCLAVPGVRVELGHLLGLTLHSELAPAPRATVSRAAGIFLANIRSTGWPLLMLAAGLHCLPALRRVVDVAVIASVAANLVPVGVALATYRLALVPFIPHLPIELWAIATGPACWYLASRGRLRGAGLTFSVVLLVVALVVAAGVETWAVPHH